MKRSLAIEEGRFAVSALIPEHDGTAASAANFIIADIRENIDDGRGAAQARKIAITSAADELSAIVKILRREARVIGGSR